MRRRNFPLTLGQHYSFLLPRDKDDIADRSHADGDDTTIFATYDTASFPSYPPPR